MHSWISLRRIRHFPLTILTSMDNEPRPFKLAHPGGRRVKGQKQADGLRYGNSREYLEARLCRDAAEGVRTAAILLQGVRNGTVSLYAASCEMNYTRRREPNGRGSENMAKARDWRLHKLLNPRPPQGKAPPGGTSEA
jgi:hypothetical protein